jgi:hypothetical protein
MPGTPTTEHRLGTVGRYRVGQQAPTLRSLVGLFGPHQGGWRRVQGSDAAPAIRFCTGSSLERKPRSDAEGTVLHGLGHQRPVTLDRHPAGPVAAVALHLGAIIAFNEPVAAAHRAIHRLYRIISHRGLSGEWNEAPRV